jgi:hypothetical protein
VDDKQTKKRLDDATLSAVKEEMAKPRLAASVRRTIGRTMDAHAKFNVGVLLHNRNTNEDGLVKRVYEVGGAVMYEVSIPATPLTYNISDWGESPLELSNNKQMASGRPPRDWAYQR